MHERWRKQQTCNFFASCFNDSGGRPHDNIRTVLYHSLFISSNIFFLVKIVYIVQESCLNDCKLVKNTGWWNKLITYGISMTTSVVFVPIYPGCPNLQGFQDPSRWAIARDTKSSDISWFTISFSTMLLIIQYRAEPMATELVYNRKILRP